MVAAGIVRQFNARGGGTAVFARPQTLTSCGGPGKRIACFPRLVCMKPLQLRPSFRGVEKFSGGNPAQLRVPPNAVILWPVVNSVVQKFL